MVLFYISPMSIAQPESQLWQSVLLAAALDIKSPNAHLYRERARDLAIAWVGAFPSKDFRMVCALAGLEPDHIHPQFLKLIETVTGGQGALKSQMRFAAE
jgi:hypothetical protein